MFAGKQTDLIIGLDIHMEMIPAPPAPPPAGIPTPFPMPFIGMIEFSPIGTLIGVGIAAGMSAVFGTPPSGPVLVNGIFEGAKTGDEATNKITCPHFVIPPGFMWTPLPKPLKLKIKPPPPAPDNPAAPPGDAILITGSKTVKFSGSNASRLPDLAMSCSDPVRLPSSVLLAIPKGLPVLVGGPPALDLASAAKAFFLRNKWAAGAMHQVVCRIAPGGRLRNLLSWGVCQLTGHPVDVATGRLLTRGEDFTLRGPIPITFERYYSSAWSERASPLGYGWSHTLHEGIWLERGKVIYKMGDGREVEFQCAHLPGRYLPDGGEVFYPIDRLTLRSHGQGHYEVRSPDGLTRDFAPLPGNPHVSLLTRIRDRIGHFVDLAYDQNGLLETVTTSEGRWIRLEHRDGLLRRIAVPIAERDDGWYNQVTFEYSVEGDLAKAIDSLGHARVYRYEHHLMIQETDRDGVTFWFEYDGRDSHASCIRTWGNDGKGQDRLFFREITYDKANKVTLVEDSLGNVSAYKMNMLNGVEEIIDPHGASIKFEYNEFLWKTAEIDALGNATRFEHDARGNETKRLLPNGATLTVRYDAYDLPVSMTDLLGVEWRWTYDGCGRPAIRQNSLGEVLAFEYSGRILRSAVRADQSRYCFEYDGAENISKVTLPDGTTQERWYDRHGRIVKVRDALGRAQRFAYDWEARLVQLEETGGLWRQIRWSPGGDVLECRDNLRHIRFDYVGYHRLALREEASQKIQYRYSSEDDLISVVNEVGEDYSFTRDACGRIIQERGFEGRRHLYVRDAAGQVTVRTRPSKEAEIMTYDAMGNIASMTYPDGSRDTFEYDAVGNLISATNASGTVRWERDARGRVVKESFEDDWVASRHDALGERVEVTSSRGLQQKISRTPMGDVLSVGTFAREGNGIAHATWGVNFERDAIGREIARSMPGGVVATRSYTDSGLPSARELARGKERLARTDYAWAGDNRLQHQVDLGIGTTYYAHDARGRLDSARFADGAIQVRAPGPSGNLYKRRDQKDRLYGATGILREADGVKFLYNSNGSLISKQGMDGEEWRYVWNGAEMLSAVERPDGVKIEFSYDALGRRVRKIVRDDKEEKTTQWRWDRHVPVHEWTSGVDEEEIAWLFEPDNFSPLGKIVQREGARPETHSIVTNYLGTPTEMLDEAGEIAWQAQLDIYGVARISYGEPANCPWRWPGQYEDEETGLYYNRFRYYDPSRGDYLSQDPIGLAGGVGLYAYVFDPLMWVDPSGLNQSGGGTPCFKWGNPKSTPTYGHTFTDHTSRLTPTQLADRARNLGHQTGQWMDDKSAAAFIATVAQRGPGVHDVPLPAGMGRSFLADGTQLTTDMARVIVRPNGGVKTAFPFSSANPN